VGTVSSLDVSSSLRDILHVVITRDQRVLDKQAPFFVVRQVAKEHALRVGGDRMKVISMAVAFFLDGFFTFSPHMGYDTNKRLYTILGSPETKLGMTSMHDIALTTVRVAIMATEDSTAVPDVLLINGDTKSTAELAGIITKISGDKVRIETEDLEEFKAKMTDDSSFVDWLRYGYGSGASDFSKSNHNELINPDQKFWKWETFEEFAIKKRGSEWN